jgi:hypothetical protein
MAHDVATHIYEIAKRDAAKEEAEMLERRSFSLKVFKYGDYTRIPVGTLDVGFDSKGMVHVAHAHGRDPPNGASMMVIPYSSMPVVIDAFLYGNSDMARTWSTSWKEDKKLLPHVKVILYRRQGQTRTQQLLVQQWGCEQFGYITRDELAAKYMQIIDFARSIQS